MTADDTARLDTLVQTMREMKDSPYWHKGERAPTRLDKARSLYVEGGVTCDALTGLYTVQGSNKHTTYTFDRECPCEATVDWCYHRIAAAIHRKMHAAFRNEDPARLPTPPDTTGEERLAQSTTADPAATMPTTAQNSPGSTNGGQDVSEDTQNPEAPQTLLEAQNAVARSQAPGVPLYAPGPPLALAQAERSTCVINLMQALVQAQAAIDNPVFDKTNPHFKSRYASLAGVRDAVTPALTAAGLAVTQLLSTEPGMAVCTTVLWHTSGQYLSSTLRLPVKDQTPQGYGSALTYARRYSLMALVNVYGDEDDDGERATRGSQRGETVTPEPPPAPQRVASSGNKRAEIVRLLRDLDYTGTDAQGYIEEVFRLTGLDLKDPLNYQGIIWSLETLLPNKA